MNRFLTTLLLLVSFTLTKAQTPIYWYDFDEQNLTKAITEEINSIRDVNRLSDLKITSELLSKAKRSISTLTYKNGNIKFEQPGLHKTQRDPEHESTEYFILSKLEDSYELLALQVLIKLKEEGFEESLLDGQSSSVGLAVSLLESLNRVAVFIIVSNTNEQDQVLSSQKSNKKVVVTKLPFGIKDYQYNHEFSERVTNCELKIEEGKISSFNPKEVKKLFKNKRDGLVFEIVNKSQADCNSEIYASEYNRRNFNSSINGKIYLPVYKKELLRDQHFKVRRASYKKYQAKELRATKLIQQKLKQKLAYAKRELSSYRLRKIFSLGYGKADKEKLNSNVIAAKLIKAQAKVSVKKVQDSKRSIRRTGWEPIYWEFQCPDLSNYVQDSLVEINTLILNKNRISYPLYYSYLKVASKFKDSVSLQKWDIPVSSLKIEPDRRKFFTKVRFERNQKSVDDEVFERFKDELDGYLIDTIVFSVYASVEGSKNINEILFKNRSDSISFALEEFKSDSTVFNGKMSENWALCYEQIESNKDYSTWKDLDQDSIRSLINAVAQENPWKEYLEEQRTSIIEVSCYKYGIDTLKYLKNNFDFKDVRDQKEVLSFLINESIRRGLSEKYVKKLKFNRDSAKYSPHILDKFLFEYYSNKDSKDFNAKAFFRRFLSTINARVASTELLSKYINLLVTQFDGPVPNMPGNYKVFLELKRREVNTRDMVVFAIKAMKYYSYYFDNPKARYYNRYIGAETAVEQLPNHIYNFYSLDTINIKNKSNALELSKLFLEFDRPEYADLILQSYEDNVNFDSELKALQLKINYEHPFTDKSTFISELIYHHSTMTTEDWCDLFAGKNSISFQALDSSELRVLYCSECGSQ